MLSYKGRSTNLQMLKVIESEVLRLLLELEFEADPQVEPQAAV